MTDYQLIRLFAERGDREAIGALIGRYVDLVYSAALRQVRHRPAVEDVTQGVFLLLLEKAGTFGPEVRMGAWLLQATYYASLRAGRDLRRRGYHERKAAGERIECVADGENADDRPWLDAAMGKLRERDRAAVMLRFWRGLPLAEVGAQLGMSQEAARKRVDRAVDKLRQLAPAEVQALGVAGIGVMIGESGVHAPEGLLAKALSQVSGSEKAAMSIAKWAKAGFVMAKVKVAAMILGGLCLATGVGAVVVAETPAKGHDAASTAPPTQTSTAAVVLPGGGRVELVGVADYPSKDRPWWQPDGSNLATAPCDSWGPSSDPIAVLVTEGNPTLKQAVIAALAPSSLQVITPKEYEANPPYYADLVVFDRYQPKWPGSHGMFLYFAAVPAHWRPRTPVGQNAPPASNETLAVSTWKRDHIALRDVAFDKLTITRAMHLTPPVNAEVLAESSQGPLIVFERRDDQEHMVVAFGAGDANWDARSGLATFVSDAVDYLTQTAHDSYRQFQFALRVSNLPPDIGCTMNISPSAPNGRGATGMWSNRPVTKDGRPVAGLITAQWNLKPTADTATVRLLLAPDAKETLDLERDGRVTGPMGSAVRQFLPATTSEQVWQSANHTVLTLGITAEAAKGYEWSVKAFDIVGREHTEAWSSYVDVDGKTKPTVGFALPLEQVSGFILTARPYRYAVTFANVSLGQGKMADVKSEVSELHP